MKTYALTRRWSTGNAIPEQLQKAAAGPLQLSLGAPQRARAAAAQEMSVCCARSRAAVPDADCPA
eukprot:15471997-Alexandrium_andersonii.AAC.1